MENKINPETIEWTEGKVKNFYGRDLLVLENGTLKMVKVAPHASYPEHLHPDKTEYIYVLNGCPNIIIGENNYDGKIGDFFIFPKKIKHAIQNNTNEESILLVGAIKD